jgi:predicted GNAT family acetyltransferase
MISGAGNAAGSDIRVSRSADVEGFRERVLPFLCQREAENCLPIGILATPGVKGRERYLGLVEAGGDVVGVALMTPPAALVIAAGTRSSTLGALVDDLAASTFPVSGVIGPTDIAEAFAAAWSARSGCVAHHSMAERIYQLEAVRPTTRAAGRIRRATPADRSLLVEWLDAFTQEALNESDLPAAGDIADRYLAGPASDRGLFLWEDGGRPVSMAGIAGPTPNGIRVNAVYTPRELRGRGYATACVAALSSAQLRAGRRYCFLFTDVANATANEIYQRIGYVAVGDVDQYEFSSPRGKSSRSRATASQSR